MIYLATPYTHPDAAVMEQRFELACRLAGALMARGLHVYSPIAHTHPIAVRCALPREFDYWEKYDRAMIERMSEVWVVTAEGWEDSRGIKAEIELAAKLRKPLRLVPPERILSACEAAHG